MGGEGGRESGGKVRERTRAGPSCQIRPMDLRLRISLFLDLRFKPWPLSGSEMGGLSAGSEIRSPVALPAAQMAAGAFPIHYPPLSNPQNLAFSISVSKNSNLI